MNKVVGRSDKMEKVLFTWSGGKDSAMALHELLKGEHHEVAALLTTVTGQYDRVSMHGVRRALLKRQAASLGLPLDEIFLTPGAADREFEERMREKLEHYRDLGVSSVAFGDIFLEDLRRYREENLSKIGMKGIFPIWQRDTASLAKAFVSLGFKAVVTCVDSQVLAEAFVGRDFDERFLNELPPTVDPCGERGEFHTFVYDGPIFHGEICFVKGEVVLRENRFYFCDLIPPP
ncbi:MAG: diphthine--ammonia ligase [Thermodesulfobacteriota bacterium]